jgi:hypothetical protein
MTDKIIVPSSSPISKEQKAAIDKINAKYGSYYDNLGVTGFDGKNVFYIGYIGYFNGEEIFKYGVTSNVFVRDVKKHRNEFEIFDMVHIEECDNMLEIKRLFKREMMFKKMNRTLTVNGKTHTDLFTFVEYWDMNQTLMIVNQLIMDNPSVKKIKEKLSKLRLRYQLLQKNISYDLLQKDYECLKAELEYKTEPHEEL